MICLVLICHCLVVVVVPTSTLIVITLQRDEAGTNMCWPVLVPQMMGGEEPPGLLTVKVSVAQSPTRGPSDMAAAVKTGVVIPSGAARTMVSKSIRSLQTSEFVLQNL